MGDHRFFIKQVEPTTQEVKFPVDISHQIRHVLRLKLGSHVTVLDGAGRAYQVELTRFDSESVVGKILEVRTIKSNLPVHMHLYFPLSKKQKTEWILQKGTEVGVFAFHPFISKRSLVQSVELSEKRRTRWESIIREAAEQSGRGQLPVLNKPDTLPSAISVAQASHDQVITAWVGEGERNLKDSLSDTAHQIGRKNNTPSLGLFVGPEGGFSADEIGLLKGAGAETVSLGARVMRMETAAVVFPAFVIYEMGNLQRSE